MNASLPPLSKRRPAPRCVWLIRTGLPLTFLLGLALVGWSIFMNESALATFIDEALSPDLVASKARAAQFARNWLLSSETGRAFCEQSFWSHADLVGGMVAGLALLMFALVIAAPRGVVLVPATIVASPGIVVLVAAAVAVFVFIAAIAVTFLMLALAAVAALGATGGGE